MLCITALSAVREGRVRSKRGVRVIWQVKKEKVSNSRKRDWNTAIIVAVNSRNLQFVMDWKIDIYKNRTIRQKHYQNTYAQISILNSRFQFQSYQSITALLIAGFVIVTTVSFPGLVAREVLVWNLQRLLESIK